MKIELNINYPFPIHKMKAYNNDPKVKFKNLNITEKSAKGIFSLPLYPKLREADVLKIAKLLKKVLIKNNW